MMRSTSTTRGHPYKLYKQHFSCTARSSFYTERVRRVTRIIWNSLPVYNIQTFHYFQVFIRHINRADFLELRCVVRRHSFYGQLLEQLIVAWMSHPTVFFQCNLLLLLYVGQINDDDGEHLLFIGLQLTLVRWTCCPWRDWWPPTTHSTAWKKTITPSDVSVYENKK